MRVGLILNHEEEPGGISPRWEDVRGFAQDAEAAGVDAVWIADHFLWDGDPWGRDDAGKYGSWEAWTTLAALCQVTSRIRLGTLVSCTGYRNPAVLAKMADSVDQMSGGRLVLGLGAGDAPEEHERFGFDFGRRVSRFAEALEIIVPLLRTGSVEFAGEFYTVRGAELRPRPPGTTGPPILIGSLAHRPRVLSLVARHADISNGWMTHQSDPVHVPPLRAAVDAACVAIGRDPASLARSTSVAVAYGPAPVDAITGAPEEIAETFRAFAAEGIDELQVRLFPNDRTSVERFAPVLEALR
jgi:alkanesulfonate monooxygenase SsuD/methylene tetrahydromethanopterin reductase-like flavin-dependent oxidoreductase (luciferase family)